jgi:Flp pilus assembly protein CpaB
MRTPTPDAAARRRRLHRRLRAAAWRARFVLVAVCCGLAATATVQALRPEPPPTLDVVVPAHPLVAGEEVGPDDVTVRTVPAELVPGDVLTDPRDAVGRVPAVTLPAGLPLHGSLVEGGGLAAQAPEGTVVVPVLLDGAASGLLRPGDRVDLVTAALAGALDDPAPDDASVDARYLARRALVLPDLRRAESSRGADTLLGGATASRPAQVTLLAVRPEEAPALSAASGQGSVSAVLVP